MEVLLSDRQRRLPRAARILKAIVRRVVEAEDPDVDEVDVVIADDALLADLNARFRNKPRTTDVLSFPGSEVGPHRHLGEVVVSSDRVIEQAPRHRHPVEDEMARLIVHGLLHLLGYEHDTTSGRRTMRRAERVHLDRLRPWIDKLGVRYQSNPT